MTFESPQNQPSYVRQRQALGENIEYARLKRGLGMIDKQQHRELSNEYYTGMLRNMNAVHQANQVRLDDAERNMPEHMRRPGERLRDIIKKLRQAPPSTLGEKPTRNGYIELSQSDKVKGQSERLSFYTVSFRDVMEDLKFVRDMMQKAYPDPSSTEHQALQNIEQSLVALAETDTFNFQYNNYRNAISNKPAARAFSKIGRLGAVVLFGGYTLLTGVQAVANKKFSVAPILGAAGVYLSAVGLDGIQSPKGRRELQQALDTVQNRDFHYLSQKYQIEGKQWADTLENMMSKRGERAIKAFEKKLETGSVTDQETEDFLDEFFSKADPLRSTMKSMIQNRARATVGGQLPTIARKNDFALFAEILRRPSNREVKRFVYDYVEAGAWKHSRV